MAAAPRRTHRSQPGARLTGGEAAGRRLGTEAAPDLRPTTALVRAACFNILGPQVGGSRVADLFAGTGSLGLEALSRGAAGATFVEVRRSRADLIRMNLERLGYRERAEVVLGDVLAWLDRRSGDLVQTDLILLDPPYSGSGPDLGLAALARMGATARAHSEWTPTVVLGHHRSLSLPERAGALNCVRSARYGSSALAFFRRSP
ncbi:MAG: 16S rRNA (guanine(966)-N(2))-methyltransferase RsmD [Candidatus Dormibacteria bacterium]